jgi:hypothetical protein
LMNRLPTGVSISPGRLGMVDTKHQRRNNTTPRRRLHMST